MSIKKIFKCFNRSVKRNSEKYNIKPAKLRERGKYRSSVFEEKKVTSSLPNNFFHE